MFQVTSCTHKTICCLIPFSHQARGWLGEIQVDVNGQDFFVMWINCLTHWIRADFALTRFSIDPSQRYLGHRSQWVKQIFFYSCSRRDLCIHKCKKKTIRYKNVGLSTLITKSFLRFRIPPPPPPQAQFESKANTLNQLKISMDPVLQYL